MLNCHSDAVLLVHVVWSTVRKQGRLEEKDDPWLKEALADAARVFRCALLGIGIAQDHVHCLIELSTTAALAEVVQRMKGLTSWARRRLGHGSAYWQNGYWARSVDSADGSRLLDYFSDQRAKHAALRVVRAYEPPPRPGPII